QRQRLIASLVFTVADNGYNETTIVKVIQGASVTTRTFYKYFDGIEAVYLAAFEAAVDSLGARLAAAYGSETEWPLRVRASLAALLEFFAASPELARLCLTEPFVAGPAISRHYQEAIGRLAPYLREGPEPFPETTERGLLGSIGTQIGRKVSAGEAEDLPGLLPDLVQFALTPYLGAAEARRVALSAD
ncbi:MAG TPA: TetR/AcrR family transcriptional regulator, partial [Solirubrobacterales bacterium]